MDKPLNQERRKSHIEYGDIYFSALVRVRKVKPGCVDKTSPSYPSPEERKAGSSACLAVVPKGSSEGVHWTFGIIRHFSFRNSIGQEEY
jgi:hypothetical protein